MTNYMTNFGYYKDELAMMDFNFSVDKISGKLLECSCENCAGCKFAVQSTDPNTNQIRFDCSKQLIVRWLYTEYKLMMNKLEFRILLFMLARGYEWVSRDDDFTITFFTLKPIYKDGTWSSPEKGFDEPLNCVPLCEELFEFLREGDLFEMSKLLGICEVTDND